MLAGNTAYVPPAYYHLATYTVTGSAETVIEFTNLDTSFASTYKHLQIFAVARSDRSGAHNEPYIIRANSDSGSNYSWHSAYGYGGGSGAGAGANASYLQISDGITSASSATGTFGATLMDIPNAFSTNTYKTFQTLNGYASPGYGITIFNTGNWRNTSAISSLSFEPLIGTNFLVGSTISIFGLKV